MSLRQIEPCDSCGGFFLDQLDELFTQDFGALLSMGEVNQTGRDLQTVLILVLYR